MIPKMQVLVIGAHPDDVEIGAGALIAKACAEGHDVYILVLTDDPHDGDMRRAEAERAALELGVPANHLLFTAMPDGYLRADGGSVRAVRTLVAKNNIYPDVVVTHTQADSHNDHVEAHRIAHAVFRECVYLHYSTHLSVETDRFQPQVFVDASAGRLAQKSRALSEHRSQVHRINRHDLAEYEERLGGFAGLVRAEGFEVGYQYRASEALRNTLSFNDSSFHQFWAPVIMNNEVALLYESYSHTSSRPFDDWSLLQQNSARDRLRQAFTERWAAKYPLREQYANTAGAATVAKQGSVILTGGPAVNNVVHKIYNKMRSSKWVVESNPHGYQESYLCNQSSGQRLAAEISAKGRVRHDVGLISRVPSPFVPGAFIIYVAGSTSFATGVGVDFLTDPGKHPSIAEVFRNYTDAQLVFSVDVPKMRVQIIDHDKRGGLDG